MLPNSKKRKYDRLRGADFKVLKEEDLEKPSKKTSHPPKKLPQETQMQLEESKGSESEQYDTEFEDEFDDEFGNLYKNLHFLIIFLTYFAYNLIEDEEIIEENPLFIENPTRADGIRIKKKKKKDIIEEEEEEEEKAGPSNETQQKSARPFLGTSKSLKKDEFLDFDNKAYEMLHRAHTEW